MAEESDDFFDAMKDVKPLISSKRVTLRPGTLNNAVAMARRQAATAELSADDDPLANSVVEQVEPNAILAYRRPGVQHGVYRQLRLGKYLIEARLDLHQMKLEPARMAVYRFIRDCLENDVRCALITHGKGEGRANPAFLKSHVAYWLPQIDEVLAFHSAQKHHGGAGATYVMLKKSEKKRLENLERHQRKR